MVVSEAEAVGAVFPVSEGLAEATVEGAPLALGAAVSVAEALAVGAALLALAATLVDALGADVVAAAVVLALVPPPPLGLSSQPTNASDAASPTARRERTTPRCCGRGR